MTRPPYIKRDHAKRRRGDAVRSLAFPRRRRNHVGGCSDVAWGILARCFGDLRCFRFGPALLGWFLCAEAIDHEISVGEDGAELQPATERTDILLQRA